MLNVSNHIFTNLRSRIEVVEEELVTALHQLAESIEAQRRNPHHMFDSRVRQINYGACGCWCVCHLCMWLLP
jgi:hypothetical protein